MHVAQALGPQRGQVHIVLNPRVGYRHYAVRLDSTYRTTTTAHYAYRGDGAEWSHRTSLYGRQRLTPDYRKPPAQLEVGVQPQK